jgi:hypothetical protein
MKRIILRTIRNIRTIQIIRAIRISRFIANAVIFAAVSLAAVAQTANPRLPGPVTYVTQAELCMPALSFASVVAGDDQLIFELGIGSIYSGQSVTQSFTLPSDTTVNLVDPSFLALLLHSLSRAYPLTIQEALP